ncbi:RNA polymerase sigma factor [Novipirellula herctigrandis]|uniref:RNA polymerase sigma factor n=1 Tax=Novipirellula herctigrandis TaxID=2527986 RepID=UPI003AF37492
MRLQNSRDEQAWAEFAAVYEPVIYRMTLRRGLQDADAREIVQEVLLSVTSAIDRFDVEANGSFRGWLSRITRNATIDRFRQQTARGETIDASGVARLLDEATANEKVADEFEHDCRRQLFRWAAGEVRRRTGEVNWMAFWKTSVDGCDVADVARELDIGEGAVYVARCRILKRIRELVDERLSE